MTRDITTTVGLVVAILLAVTGIFTGGSDGQDGRDGRNGTGAVTSPNVHSYMNVHGAFSQGGGPSTVTPTSGAHTLTFAQMNDYNVITFTASTTMPALTATLPATTTFPLGTKAGSYRTWVIENPFTAAATTTTLAAGTGVDLQEPDGQNVVIGINNYAWLTCLRESSSDIVCRVDESIPAD